MPKLRVFAPCEKVIIDAAENTVSLITILGEINVTVVPNDPVPQNTLIPMYWTAFALWHKEAIDEGKKYESRCTLLSQKDEVLVESVLIAFEMTKFGHNNLHKFPGFPVWAPGQCLLKLWLREVGQQEWKEVADFPVRVKHVSPSEAT